MGGFFYGGRCAFVIQEVRECSGWKGLRPGKEKYYGMLRMHLI